MNLRRPELRCYAAVGWMAAVATAFPQRYVNIDGVTKCWVSPGEVSPLGRMWSGGASGNAVLQFSPDLPSPTTYSPGQSYTVTIHHPEQQSIGMLGSSAGSWTTSASGSACSYSGLIETTSGVWTAPASGDVTLGGSVSNGPGAMEAAEITLSPGATATTDVTTSSSTQGSTTPPQMYEHWQYAYTPHMNSETAVPDGFQYYLSWNISEADIVVRVEAQTSGWVGLGIGEDGGGGMMGSDLVVCNSQGWISDRYALEYAFPPEDGKQDWTLLSSGTSMVGTFCIMSRALDTFDKQDHSLSRDKLEKGPVNLLFAYGSSSEFAYHGRGQRTTAHLNLLRPQDSIRSLRSMSDYDTNVTLYNGNVHIPHDQASCAAFGSQCRAPHTTYFETTHEITAYNGRTLIAFQPHIQANTSAHVHHFVLYGYRSSDCNEDSLMGPLYIWAPGAPSEIYPPFLGISVRPGRVQCVKIQTHYDNANFVSGLIDNSGVILHMTAPGVTRQHEVGIYQIGDPQTRLTGRPLPGGLSTFVFECGPANFVGAPDITIYKLAHHMHVAGQIMRTNLTRPGMETVEWTTEFFDEAFQTPIYTNTTFNGAQSPTFFTSCTFNTANDTGYPYSNPSGAWGLGSNDEMCIDFMYYWPAIDGVSVCDLNLPSSPGSFELPNPSGGFTPTNIPQSVEYLSIALNTPDESGGLSDEVQNIASVYCSDDYNDDDDWVHLVYCSYDGSNYFGNWYTWYRPVRNPGPRCENFYPVDPQYFRYTQARSGVTMQPFGPSEGSYRITCVSELPSTGSNMIGESILSSAAELGRVFGTFTGTYAPTQPPPSQSQSTSMSKSSTVESTSGYSNTEGQLTISDTSVSVGQTSTMPIDTSVSQSSTGRSDTEAAGSSDGDGDATTTIVIVVVVVVVIVVVAGAIGAVLFLRGQAQKKRGPNTVANPATKFEA